MPKSGKSIVAKALIGEGWTHISMSGLLKQRIMQDEPITEEEVTRQVLFDRVIKYRHQFGGGFVAQLCLDHISTLPNKEDRKFIIDGVRHPGEIDTLQNSGNSVYFAGIIADENPVYDETIRFDRLRSAPTQRGEHFEEPDREAFHQTDVMEWDNPATPWGSKIGPCLALIKSKGGKIFVNGSETDMRELEYEVKTYAGSLEGSGHQPERGK